MGNQFETKSKNFPSTIFDTKNVELIYSSKNSLLFRNIQNDNDRDDHSKMRLFLVNRQDQEFSLNKKFDSVNNFDIVTKSNEVFLVYSSYLGPNVKCSI
jgi:hypothetical protein